MDESGLCRVEIDLKRIQHNLKVEGGLLQEQDVANWLRCIGFAPEPDGNAWRGTEDCLLSLDRSEFRRVS